MSTTSARVEIPAARWSIRKSAILVALVIALLGGAFGVYALTRPGPAAVEADAVRVGGTDCTANFTTAGGVVEDQTFANACGSPGGSDVPGALRIP